MPSRLPRKKLFSLLPTPFEEDGGIDLFAFDRVLSHQTRGSAGVAVGFPVGEGQTLSFADYRLLLQEAVLFCAGRRTVAAFCGAPDTARALDLAQMAAQAGADLLVLPPPYGVEGGSSDYFCHLRALSLVGVPFVAVLPVKDRRAPARGQSIFLCEEIARLPHFQGFICDGLDDPCWSLWLAAHPEAELYIQRDELLSCALFSGFAGAFSPLSALLPVQCTRLVREIEGQSRRAEPLQRALYPPGALLCAREGDAFLKWGLHKKGLLCPVMRLPRTLPDPRALAEFERTLRQAERAFSLASGV